MGWEDGREDWGVEGVNNVDMNRIEGNNAAMHRGNGQPILNPIAISGSLNERFDLPNSNEETFLVPDKPDALTNIYYMSLNAAGGREPGNRVQLILRDLNNTITFISNQPTPPAGYLAFRGPGNRNTPVDAYAIVSFVYDGTFWVMHSFSD